MLQAYELTIDRKRRSVIECGAMKTGILRRYIGDRAFYRHAMAVTLPIMLQNVVTNFVSLLDNIMVGQTGTASMSGVAVVGQLFFIFYLVIFGTVSGPGIYCAQYWGAADVRSFKAAFRYKLLSALLLCGVCAAVLLLRGPQLVGLYLTGGDAERLEVLDYAMGYLRIMLWGMLPFTVSMVYSSTLRETGRTVPPMVASWVAVFVNLILNWILIFGKLGAPAMGVRGAAAATVVSRLCEMGINMIWSHVRGGELLFTQRMLEGFPAPAAFVGELAKKSVPLMLNETLWCLGMATLTQIYSTRGLAVVAALNIGNVLMDLFTSVAFSIGTTIGIVVGQELGAGETEKAVDTDRKMLALGVTISIGICLTLLSVSQLFPRFYNTTPAIRALASRLICVMALVLPFDSFAHGCYFTIRSGGKTAVTFLFDSGFSWVVIVPTAFLLARHTGLAIVPLYAICSFTVVLKALIGGFMVNRRYWVNTLTGTEEHEIREI